MIRNLFRRVGVAAIASFLWHHRGSVVRTFDLALRVPQLLLDRRLGDAITEAKAVVALDSRLPTRTDIRIAGFQGGQMTVRGDVALDCFQEARAALLAVGDVVDVRTSPDDLPTVDDALTVARP